MTPAGQPVRRSPARVCTLRRAITLAIAAALGVGLGGTVGAGASRAAGRANAPTAVHAAQPALTSLSPLRALFSAQTLATRSSEVFPSQADVDAARAAAAGAASGAAQAQARYDAAAVELLRLQGVVAEASAVAATAEATLRERTAEADRAAATAASESRLAETANLAVRRDAAILWQTHDGDAADWIALASASGPQDVADLASAIRHVSERREATWQRAQGASLAATESERHAQLTREQQQRATEEARRARDAAQAQVDTANARTRQLQQEQNRLVAELARLRGVAEQVERDRQDALAAEAARIAAEKAAAERRAQEEAAAAAAAAAAGSPGAGGWSPGGGLSPNEARAAARSMMSGWGFGDDQWGCLDSLWTGESDWQWWARNPSSGAYGIPQSLPATKMGTAGGDWLSNANTQISWGLSYIQRAYGTPCAAWNAWLSRSPHWY